MNETTGDEPDREDLDLSWEGSRRQQLRRIVLTTTPAQRLEWLEDAIDFAYHAGALARRGRDGDPR